MGKVLKADGQVATAWAAIDLGSDQADVWITHQVYFDDAAVTWFMGSSPNFLDWWDNTADFATYTGFINGLFVDEPPAWSESAGSAEGGTPTPNWWQGVEVHYQSDGTIDVYVGGVLVFSDVSTSGALRWIRAELDTFGATPAPGAVVYIRDVKVGTTRGGSDLFADDFSSGDLAAWTSASGDVSVVDDPFVPPPPPPAPAWTVEHYQHEYVPDPDAPAALIADGSLIQIVRPENLHFVLTLGQVGISTIEYDIARDAKDDDGDPIITQDFVGPYRTDFLLKKEGVTDPIMGGMHTQVSGLDGDDPLDVIQIGGKEWLHYLERRNWPYDVALSQIRLDLDGFLFKATAVEVGAIIANILQTVRDLSANYPGPPDEFGPNPSYSLGFTIDVDDTGFSTNYEIPFMDSTSIFAMIQQLSLMGLTRGGFDFTITPAKVFRLIYPEIGDPDSPIYTLEVDATTHIANMESVGFTNTGPGATHVLGVGAGTASQPGGINKHFPANSAVFRRLDKVAEFATVKNLDALESLTSLELAFGANPIHEIPVIVNPAEIPDFWTLTRPGMYVAIDYDLGFHHINSTQKIISMDCRVDTEGEEEVQLTFNQHYDASDDAGIADW